MTKSRLFARALLLAAVVATTGCASLMGNLRRDLDDGGDSSGPPVVGGRYSEHGFLADDMSDGGPYSDRYAAVGHSERNPASGSGARVSGDSWVSQDQDGANRRDRYRGQADDGGDDAVSFSNTPSVQPQVKRQYKNGSRATRADFVDETPNEGSLWGSDGQTNYYFTKNKVRGVGDILTVSIEQDLVRDIALETRRTLTPREKDIELALAQERIRARVLGLEDPDAPKKDSLASSAAAPQRSPAQASAKSTAKAGASDGNEGDIPPATFADVDLTRTLDIKAGETMLAEIVERYPNGNYKIRGTKKVPYKNGAPRLITLVGVARAADISEDDIINSGKLYEYRLEAVR